VDLEDAYKERERLKCAHIIFLLDSSKIPRSSYKKPCNLKVNQAVAEVKGGPIEAMVPLTFSIKKIIHYY
jgi:hypothetical protein